ncbi:MAG: ferric reductase-like transmembrane domain-containing protein [Deltaproteobacteria bacterium]|nr:ferric reductase-like transmembrane domain-containing protein [Deltaproteobacteria bacterium]
MLGAVSRLVLYTGLVSLPVVLAALLDVEPKRFASELGKHCALMAFVILILQFVMAARIQWIERAFGFDILIRFHKRMAVFAGFLLLAHPLLLAAGGGGWRLLVGLDLPWVIWLGKATLLILLLNICLSSFQRSFGVKFEKWRLGHDIGGPLIIAMAFTQSWVVGHDLRPAGMKALWVVALVSAICLFVYHVLVRPRRLKRQAYRVIDVQPETEDVWTVRMSPPEGRPIYRYLPGQFHFVTFYRNRNLPVEEHHWTISSSPTEEDYVSSTIKASGDFTSTMGRTKVGDRAAVHGAFGRFSYVLHPEENDLVFVAGGIGITPLMSMLRHMRDTQDTRSVLLVYANREKSRIVFRKELSEIEAGGHPRLKVVHVLSRPNEGWQGETGHVDGEKIERLCGEDLGEKTFYVCGPPPMLKAVVAALKNMHVRDKRIRVEIFSFLE